MEILLLGDVQAWHGGHRLEVGSPRQQAVLAALAVDLGRPVAIDTLIDRLWGDDPPRGARDVVYALVSRIRRGLALSLTRRSAGYQLDLEPDAVDLHRFAALVDRAGIDRAEGRPGDAERAVLLGEALALWRGVPLAGVPGPWAALVRDGQRQRRLTVLRAWADARTATGGAAAVIATLPDVLGEHPYAEPLEAALITALRAEHRDAEALDRYAAVRRRLREDLGTDPGRELDALYRALLQGEPPTPSPAPRQLPADVVGFTGRDGELARLDMLLDASPVAVLVSAVAGTAGVGKTALALHWAHRVRDRFPDGQMYVNLRGYDPQEPMPPADALAGFLRALGRRGADIPADPEERAAAYRTALDGRRMLLVLDNAVSAEQVRPLLPGAGGCLAVVTSRDSLAGLVARHGAVRVDLPLLPDPDALALLRTLLGDRVDREPAAATALIGQCARLPLALRVAAELAASRPGTALAVLVEELADELRRLDRLDAGGDPRTAVGSVFSWSYRHLPLPAARLFRRLGLHPGPDFDGYAAAALAGMTVAETRADLDVLARAHLIRPVATGRYELHDLLRAYANQLDTDAAGRADAAERLDAFLHDGAAAAVHGLYGGDLPPPPARGELPSFADPAAGRAWLDAERAHLTRIGDPQLAALLWRYLEGGGHYPDAVALLGRALAGTDDPATRCRLLGRLGTLHWRWGRPIEAADYYRRSLALAQVTGNVVAESNALNNLGCMDGDRGRYDSARDHFERALALHRRTGNPAGEANMLGNLGIIEERSGRYASARHHFATALALHQQAGNAHGEANTLNNLGSLHLRWGRYADAEQHLRRALDVHETVGYRATEPATRTTWGALCVRTGRWEEARVALETARAAAADLGDRSTEASALHQLGRLNLATGDREGGRDLLRHAAQLAREHDCRPVLASALAALGTRADLGEALSLAEATGEASIEIEVRERLAALYLTAGDRDAAAAQLVAAVARAAQTDDAALVARLETARDALLTAH